MPQGAFAGFQRQRDGASWEAFRELLAPRTDWLWRVHQGGGLCGLGTGVKQGQGMLTVSPIQPDEGDKLGRNRVGIGIPCD
jgi:hypothetical protein